MTAHRHIENPRPTRIAFATLAVALFIATLPGCDKVPEIIGFGNFEGIPLNPEDALKEGQAPESIHDPGVIPLDAPFASGGVGWIIGPFEPGVPGSDVEFEEHPIEEAFPGHLGELTSVVLGVEFAEEPMVVDVEVIDQQVVFEGDILLGHISEFQAPPGTRSAGMAKIIRRWPGGIVPFDDENMSPSVQAMIGTAVSDWNQDTGLTLIPRTNETDFIRFASALDGCSSALGRQGGIQYIFLSDKCTTGNVRHEIGHAVGLLHEHTRSDRNNFVTVDLAATNKPHNYWRHSSLTIAGVDLGPYDLGSIMHYPSFAFAIDEDVPVMLTIEGDIITAQRSELTPLDIWGVNRMHFDTWQVSFSGTSIWNTLNFSGLDPRRLLFGDFDRDGKDDVFFANGTEWKVSWSGTSAWETINTSGYRDLQVGDLDGDGRDDIFLATGSAWYVSWGGTSAWNLINNSSRTNVQLGDISGDGVDDVFMADGSRFWVSYGGTSAWTQINSSGYTDVQLGDLNGDGKDDVFLATGSRWYVSWSGTSTWDPINSSRHQNVRLADFDGDGIDDVFRANGSAWSVSWSGTSLWEKINDSGYTNLGIADFDGDGQSDVMAQFGAYGS